MPVPASDAIASDVGHGIPGLRDNLRPFSELLEESAGQRHLWVEGRGKVLITGWVAHDTTGTFVVPLSRTFDGARKNVVGVQIPREQLVPAGSLDECAATAGSFFYDPAVLPYGKTWDDGSTLWDDGSLWDQDPLLYIHPTSGSPAEVDVVVEFGFHWGSHGVWHPALGEDKITDGDLESWASASALNTPWGSGGDGSLARDSDIVTSGTYSARLDGPIPASGLGYIYQIVQLTDTVVAGQMQRLSGYYRTSEGMPSGLTARLRLHVTGSGQYLTEDGRTLTAATDGFALVPTHGLWRRFAFDFVAPSTSSSFQLTFYFGNSTGGSLDGSIWWDGLQLQPIPRFEYYDPRLSIAQIPRIEAGRPDAFFGPISTALGSLSIVNGNGVLESLFSLYDWLGAEFRILVGGRFPNDGNEVLLDDAHLIARARASEPIVGDSRATVRLDDLRAWFQGHLPRRPGGDMPARSLPQPLALGAWIDNITPILVDETANGYGVYGVVDCEDWGPGVHARGSAVVSVRVYVDQAAADRQDASGVGHYLCQLEPLDGIGAEYSYDLATGRLSINHEIQPFRYIYENTRADFNIGGSTLTANLLDSAAINSVEILRLAAWRLAARMNAEAAVSDITVTLDDLTHKVTVAKASGTLTLLCKSGASQELWAALGFDTRSDKTGALEYEGDSAVFESPAKTHAFIRVDASGYADDSDGTYTGTPGDYIRTAPDLTRFFLRELVGIPAAAIDTESFVAGRTSHSDFDEAASFYLGAGGKDTPIIDLVEQLETAFGVDFIMRVGVFYWVGRDTSVPSDVVTLVDRDYLAFQASYQSEDYGDGVLFRWKQDPTSGEWQTLQRSSDIARARFGRRHDLQFTSALVDGYDTSTRATALMTEASTKRRRFRLRVKGRLLTKSVGEKIQLTRTKGLDDTGALDEVLVRIIHKRDDWARWVSDLTVIEVV